MAMTAQQALLIGLVYFAANTSFLAGLGYFTTWRPLVNGLLVGLILGDPARGVAIGALVNVLYLGYISVGGTLGVGDAALAGILGTTIGLTVAPPNPVYAIGLGVVAGVLLGNLGFPLLTLRMSLDNRVVRAMDRAAERGNTRDILFLNIIAGQAILFALTVPCAALLAAIASTLLSLLVSMTPDWVLRGFSVAGTGMAAALGIALAMRFVFHGRGIGWFFAGTILALILPINVAWLAALCIAITAGYYLPRLLKLIARRRGHRTGAAFPLWLFFSHSSYSFERLQGSGVACALAPAIQRLYRTKEDRVAALKRHLAFFNVEPNWGSMILGIMLRMEEENAAGLRDSPTIAAARQTLMGTVSGFGDTVSQGVLLPFTLSLALGISLDNAQSWFPAGGVLLYLCLICSTVLLIGYLSFHAGYDQGPQAVMALLGEQTLKRWIVRIQWLGAFMLGALAAMPWVTGLRLVIAEGTLNTIVNVVVPLAFVLLFYVLAHKGQIKPTFIMLGIMVFGLLMALIGII